MRINQHFEYQDNFSLTAAQLGVSKWNWDCINDAESMDVARDIMSAKQYDVLPIKNKDGSFTKHHSTQEWGIYEQLNKSLIESSQRIYYKMDFRD